MTTFEILTLVIGTIAAAAVFVQIRIAVRSIKADHERRQKQATIEYIGKIWRDSRFQLESEYGVNSLTAENLSEIGSDPKREASIRNLLGALEHMATGLHTRVYNKDLMFRMAATFIIQVYHRLKPYIDAQIHVNPTIYIEFKNLAEEFEKRKESPNQIGDLMHS